MVELSAIHPFLICSRGRVGEACRCEAPPISDKYHPRLPSGQIVFGGDSNLVTKNPGVSESTKKGTCIYFILFPPFSKN